MIHQNLKDLSHSGVFPGAQTFCLFSQRVAATVSPFVKSDIKIQKAVQ